MPTLDQLLNTLEAHQQRFPNATGASGEQEALAAHSEFVPRPKGEQLELLLRILARNGKVVKKSSFDAIAIRSGMAVNFNDEASVQEAIETLTFIEIKTTSNARVKSGFSGFFFAFTEGEIRAAEVLGHQHRVLLWNKGTGEKLLTSVPEILSRSRSINWQVSIQL